jgi:RimJ/RimL family protein N-acetyltransferase
MLRFGFETLDFFRILAGHFVDNLASKRVFEKNRFRYTSAATLCDCVVRNAQVRCMEIKIHLNEGRQEQLD